jgi:hypothetical protein
MSTPSESDLLYDALDRYIELVLRWNAAPSRERAAAVAGSVGHLSSSLDATLAAGGPGAAVCAMQGALARLGEEWLVAAAEWID